MPASTSTPMRLCGITIPGGDSPKKNKELAFYDATTATNPGHALVQSAVFAARDVLWPNGQILDYSFFGGTPNQHKKVTDVIDEWTWYANVSFEESSPNNSKATLRIAFDPSKGSWSYVGNTAKTCPASQPTINLGWISDLPALSKKERGVILHEFGHVLGLMHEHESPARSGVMRLKEKEIIQYYTETQGWDADTVRKQVLDVYSQESVSNYSQFDPTSIMMYFMPGSMNEGGVDIHEVTELSMLDKTYVAINYPRPKSHPRAAQWTPGFALIAAGASPDTIKAYNEATDYNDQREYFTKDIVDRRLAEAKLSKKPINENRQHAPFVQSGLDTGLGDNELVREIIKQLDALELHHHEPQFAVNAPGSVADPVQRAIDVSKHAELVQRGVLSLLLDIAPMILLAPDIPAPGSSNVAHSVLDPNNLSIDNPVVQFGLKTFFTKLASNPVVKEVMTGAVKMAGSAVTELIKGPTAEPQHAPLGDALGRVVNGVLAHEYFRHGVKSMIGVVVGSMTVDEIQKYKQAQKSVVETDDELEFKYRMSKVATKLWKETGANGSREILQKLEAISEKTGKSEKK